MTDENLPPGRRLEHLSHSAISTFSFCPHKFELSYLQGNWGPPSLALIAGSAVDAGLSWAYKEKMEKGSLPEESQIIDIIGVDFHDRLKTAVLNPGDMPDRTLEELFTSTKKYLAEVAVNIKPKYIQREFKLAFGGMKTAFKGIIDLIDENMEVIDLKTSAKAYPDSKILNSVQLTGYQAGLEEEGEKITGLAFHVLIKGGKRLVQIQKGPPRTPQQIEYFRRAFLVYVNAIRNQRFFPPCSPDEVLCSPKFCSHYGTSCLYRVPPTTGDTEATVSDEE